MNQSKNTNNVPKDYAEPTGSDSQLEPLKSTVEASQENWKLFRVVLITLMVLTYFGLLGQVLRMYLLGECQ